MTKNKRWNKNNSNQEDFLKHRKKYKPKPHTLFDCLSDDSRNVLLKLRK